MKKEDQQPGKKCKYIIRKSDNIDTIFIKRLFNLIYNLEFEIVEFEKSSKKCLNLKITGGSYLRRYINRIVASEISKILGINLDTTKRWTNQLNLAREIEIRPTTFKKIYDHIEIFSEHVKIYNSLSRVLANYHKEKYPEDFPDRLVSIFNNYIKGGGGKSWLAQILGKSRAYIFDLELRRGQKGKGGPEHYAKYFILLTYIHLLNKQTLDFKEDLKINDLKPDCRNLVFKEMKKKEMIKDLCASKYSKRIVNTDNRDLFDIIIYSLLALTTINRAINNKKKRFCL